MVLTDLDMGECAPTLLNEWLLVPTHHNPLFRVAVREVESWVLADRDRFAKFIGIRKTLVPVNADAIDDPKRCRTCLAAQHQHHHLETIETLLRPCRQHGHDSLMN